jgi:hypothetical protein
LRQFRSITPLARRGSTGDHHPVHFRSPGIPNRTDGDDRRAPAVRTTGANLTFGGIALLTGLTVAPAASAQAVWVREVADPQSGSTSASALEFHGAPAVVYRKNVGPGGPSLVVATRDAAAWSVQTIGSPAANETFSTSDAINIGSTAYAAVGYNVAGLGGVRVFQSTPAGWQMVFDRPSVGTSYGAMLRLGAFNGQVCAVYAGVDNSAFPRQTQFLYRDSAGSFHEEPVGFVSQGEPFHLDVAQVGDEISVAQGGNSFINEWRRTRFGDWSVNPMQRGASNSFPELTHAGQFSYVFDALRPDDTSQPTQPYLLNQATGTSTWFRTTPFSTYGRVGGADWVADGDELFLAWSAGPRDQTGQLHWTQLVDGQPVDQILGPSLAGPGTRDVSAAMAGGFPMVALDDEVLPVGHFQLVVYRQVPEPSAATLLAGLLGVAVARRPRPGRASRLGLGLRAAPRCGYNR